MRLIQNKALIAQGKEPMKGKATKAKPGVVTFQDDVFAYHEWAKGGGTNETHEAWADKTASDFLRSFENHLFKPLADRETASLSTADLAAAIEPVWKTTNETGKRLCQRVHAVLEHAIGTDDHNGFQIKGTPQTASNGGCRRAFARSRNRCAPPSREPMPALYGEWCLRDKTAAYPIRFLALTCTPRAGEVFKMQWGEITYNVSTWCLIVG